HATEAFSRERDSSRNSLMGTGLGLAISKSIVKAMGGELLIESELGKGTRVTVRIPHRLSESPSVKKRQAMSLAKNFQDKRILLAEDNDINAIVAEEILRSVGFQVERATDGVVAVDMLENADSEYYDLILMDIQMPNMDGYQATRLIRTLPDMRKANLPILALTANAFAVDRQNALDAGMNGHIAKPIELVDMTEKIIAALKKQ
ncbi:MAG: response regulator, partial [Spirochaetales bacterium]|nr:response regulator [Candidatus Physcosoma equi]